MLTKSAEGGWVDAQYALGIRYYTGDFAPQNYSEAVKWFTLAAEQGHKSAANYLVDCYIHGQGVEKDSDEAIKWLGGCSRWRRFQYSGGRGLARSGGPE